MHTFFLYSSPPQGGSMNTTGRLAVILSRSLVSTSRKSALKNRTVFSLCAERAIDFFTLPFRRSNLSESISTALILRRPRPPGKKNKGEQNNKDTKYFEASKKKKRGEENKQPRFFKAPVAAFCGFGTYAGREQTQKWQALKGLGRDFRKIHKAKRRRR